MALVDQFGRPLATVLSTELARPSLTGVRSAWGTGAVSNGLTPQRLAAILHAAESGDHHAQLSLAEEMEERDLHYGSVLSTRKMAVTGLEIIVESASDSERDLLLADAVREQVKKASFFEAVEGLMDALGKGYSVVEMVWQRGQFWQPEFIWRDPHFFMPERETGAELRLIDESDLLNGVALPPHKFIVHRAKIKSGLLSRDGLARLVAIAYMCKTWTLKDWMAFADIFGLPLRVGKFGRGATEDEINTLMTAIANIASDAGAVIPESMKIEFIEASKGGSGGVVFDGLAKYLDEQISKRVLGQTMTADDGSSQAQAKVHDQVRQDIVKSDAKRLSNTLNRDFVKSFIDLNYGVQRYPEIVLYVPDNEDLNLLVTALEKLVPLGLEVEQSVIRDKFGLPDPARDANGRTTGKLLAVNKPTTMNRATALNAMQLQGDELDAIVDDALSDWQPVMQEVVDPIVQLASESSDYETFLKKITEALQTQESAVLIESLSKATFKAYGLGDSGR